MESVDGVKKDERKAALLRWLENSALVPSKIEAMAGDASFRRYFRVWIGGQTYVVMDAPPTKERCQPFVQIARALQELGLNAPQIFEADLEQGFLLLSDFGDTTFLKALTLHPDDAMSLYANALKALATLQDCRHVHDYDLPYFDKKWLVQEWAWHKEWFLCQFLGLKELENEAALDVNYQTLIDSAVQQPQVFMHRDFHSANLMVLPNQAVGLLDFQDAFIGPVTYDLASLLRDCYIDWPDSNVQTWVLTYLRLLKQHGQLVNVTDEIFLRWFERMGVERHLKALFTFARKWVRDQQPQYLQHMPRTLNYILHATQHDPLLKEMHQFYAQVVKPLMMEKLALCVQ